MSTEYYEDEDEQITENYVEKRKGRLGKEAPRSTCKVCHRLADSTYEDRIVVKVKGKHYVYNYLTFAHYSHTKKGALKITKHRVQA